MTIPTTAAVPTGCSPGRLYNYAVEGSDALATIQQAFIDLLNTRPTDHRHRFERVHAPFCSGQGTRQRGQRHSISGGHQYGRPCAANGHRAATSHRPRWGPCHDAPPPARCSPKAIPRLPASFHHLYDQFAGWLPDPTYRHEFTDGPALQRSAGQRSPELRILRSVNSTTANVLRAELAPGMIGSTRSIYSWPHP